VIQILKIKTCTDIYFVDLQKVLQTSKKNTIFLIKKFLKKTKKIKNQFEV